MDNTSYTVLILNKEISKLKEIKDTLQSFFKEELIDNDKLKEIDLHIIELQNNIDYLEEFRK